MRCLVAVLLTLITCSARADETPPVYRPMPWHLVDLWWDLGDDQPFESYSLDVTIDNDPPADTNLYIAPIGLGHLSDTPFYGGIQTQADGYTREDRRLRKIGPGLLMSMWGERSHDAIRPSLGGYFQSSGHEGDFVSVRRPYKWNRGTYTYRVVRMDREVVEGKPRTWVGAFVYSHAQDENVFVGALRFPGENLVLAQKVASFVEIYGRSIPVEQIPKIRVTFANPRVNGRLVKQPRVAAIYPQGVPDYAQAVAENEAVVVQVGQPVENRKRRQVELLPAQEE